MTRSICARELRDGQRVAHRARRRCAAHAASGFARCRLRASARSPAPEIEEVRAHSSAASIPRRGAMLWVCRSAPSRPPTSTGCTTSTARSSRPSTSTSTAPAKGWRSSWKLAERPLRERRTLPNRLDDDRRFLLKQIATGVDEGHRARRRARRRAGRPAAGAGGAGVQDHPRPRPPRRLRPPPPGPGDGDDVPGDRARPASRSCVPWPPRARRTTSRPPGSC